MGIPIKDAMLKSISWKVRLCKAKSFPNAIHFIGVVSNRTKEFDTMPFSPDRTLEDSYGISGSVCGVYHAVYAAMNPIKKRTYGNMVDRDPLSEKYEGFALGSWITV